MGSEARSSGGRAGFGGVCVSGSGARPRVVGRITRSPINSRTYGSLASPCLDHAVYLWCGIHSVSLALFVGVCLGSRLAITDDSSTYREVQQKAAAHGQGHIFAFWDGLSDDERHTLIGEVQLIDFELVEQLFRTAGNTNRFAALTQNAQPPQAIRLAGEHDQISGR